MKNNYLYTIRRHLGKGKHFGWWQIREYITNSKQGGIVEYVDPSKFTIIFRTCYLYNRPNTAKKILEGGHKQPCAWICAGSYVVEETSVIEIIDDPVMARELKYNPRKAPWWILDNPAKNCNDFIADRKEIPFIYTKKTKLYV